MVDTILPLLKHYGIPISILAAILIIYYAFTEWARRAGEKEEKGKAAEEKKQKHPQSS
jgi:hypothetical protein